MGAGQRQGEHRPVNISTGRAYRGINMLNLIVAGMLPGYESPYWLTVNQASMKKGFGCEGDYQGTWVWYEHWIVHIISYCEEHGLPIPR